MTAARSLAVPSPARDADLAPAGGARDRQERLADIAARVRTVNAETGLSTDFLNQYNELAMLLDLAADDAELLEELEGWAPRSYPEHFAASGFRDWPLVVEAYDLAPPAVRAQFDAAIDVLASVASAGIGALLKARAAGGAVEPEAILALAGELQAAIIHAGGLINGGGTLGSQAQVDTLFARARAEQDRTAPAAAVPCPQFAETACGAPESAADGDSAADGELLDQHAIDALFD